MFTLYNFFYKYFSIFVIYNIKKLKNIFLDNTINTIIK